MLAEDLTTICGEDPYTYPQGSLHSDIVELTGWIYFSTHFSSDLPGAYAIVDRLALDWLRVVQRALP